ncbi:MAG: SDR family NAD(P)-dependent oxidoreductase [Pseudomonadota bacterium]
MKDFEGKTAVITGGASGIGFALAERFADARMQLVLADIEQAALDRAVAHFESRQIRVLGVQTDTMVAESVQSLAPPASSFSPAIAECCAQRSLPVFLCH